MQLPTGLVLDRHLQDEGKRSFRSLHGAYRSRWLLPR